MGREVYTIMADSEERRESTKLNGWVISAVTSLGRLLDSELIIIESEIIHIHVTDADLDLLKVSPHRLLLDPLNAYFVPMFLSARPGLKILTKSLLFYPLVFPCSCYHS